MPLRSIAFLLLLVAITLGIKAIAARPAEPVRMPWSGVR